MKRGTAPGEDGTTVDPLEDAGGIADTKVSILVTKFLKEGRTPKSWKDADVLNTLKK